jgi:hypothetical protein
MYSNNNKNEATYLGLSFGLLPLPSLQVINFYYLHIASRMTFLIYGKENIKMTQF